MVWRYCPSIISQHAVSINGSLETFYFWFICRYSVCDTNPLVPKVTYTCSQQVGLHVAGKWKLQNVQSVAHFYVGYFSPLQNADSGEVNARVLVWSSTVYSCLTIGRPQNLLSPTKSIRFAYQQSFIFRRRFVYFTQKGRPTAVCAKLCARVACLTIGVWARLCVLLVSAFLCLVFVYQVLSKN